MPPTQPATRYREIKRLGAGGMATVTLAEDTILGRPVALKRLYGLDDPRGALRLRREALVGASLNHPNLVFVYDARLGDDGDVVIVMEFVEGETLADAIRARGALAPAEAVRVLHGIAAALDAIHEQGIVHRDVKPANVLLGPNGTVKLADLGVADVADRTRITTSGALVGSFSYMAAEQLDGAAPSPAMDVYALAAVAFEMLTGQKARPESNPLALAHAISTQPAPDLRMAWPEAPPAAAAVLTRGMSPDPAQRPGSAAELVRRLESALAPEQPTETASPAFGASGPIDRATPPAPGVAPPADHQPPPAARQPPPAARQPAPAARQPPPPARQPPPAARQPRPARPAPPPRTAGSGRRATILVPALLVLAALATAAVLVAIVSSGGQKSAGTSAANGSAHPPATSTRSRSTPASTSTSTPTVGVPPTTSAASPAEPSANGAAAATTPAGAVEQFYTDAANHQYSQAWALAGPNLRAQLGGYSAFQSQMSSVRSITFHRAQVLPGASQNDATVALSTTSVQVSRTQQCSGTARTVRAAGGWVVDGLASIICS